MDLAFVITPMMHRVPATFMQPSAFLRCPVRWLNVISEQRDTITLAPNFAYAMVTKQVGEHEIVALDLSPPYG
jgi:fatty-acyl-CoA synthase